MNFYKVVGPVTAIVNRFLTKVVTFKAIKNFKNSFDCNIDFHLKNGLTAKIVCLEPGSNYIAWSVLDFEKRAIERGGEHYWEHLYDASKFQEALDIMIRKHDATVGITWDTIDYYLDNHCITVEM